jgi:[ribosomal protein S5]-alanine N-acetyltransferase
MSAKGIDILFSNFPTLGDGDVSLREPDFSDAQSLFQIFSDPKVLEFYDIGALESEKEAQEMLQRWYKRFRDRQAIRWGITLNPSSNIVGTCGLYIQSEWNASIGYDLAQAHWRKGIMTRALSMLIKFAFETVELNRLEAQVMPGNVASELLLDKLGFTREGLLRQYGYFKGKHQDLTCYSFLRSEHKSFESA